MCTIMSLTYAILFGQTVAIVSIMMGFAQAQFRDTGCSPLVVQRYGCNFYGMDIEQRNLDQDLCAKECLRDHRCTHFTWSRSDGRCYLKQATNEQDALDTETCESNNVCGYIRDHFHPSATGHCNNRSETYYGVECFGFDRPNQPILHLSEEDCAKTCISDPHCTHYTWLQTRQCYLKHANKKTQVLSSQQCSPSAVCGINNERLAPVYKCSIPTIDTRYGCVFGGNDIETRHGVTRDLCAMACIKEPRCSHYTSTTMKTCSLHHVKNEQMALNTQQCRPEEVCGIHRDRLGHNNTCDFPVLEVGHGCTFRGEMNIESIAVATDYECQRACIRDQRCTHYTSAISKKQCYLHSADSEEKVIAARECDLEDICGINKSRFQAKAPKCSSPVVWTGYDCNYPSYDLPNMPTEAFSLGECVRACLHEQRCTHLSWLDGRQCYLKQATSRRQAIDTLNCYTNAICSLIKHRFPVS